MAVTRDPELAERMRVMRLHGMSRDAFDRFTSKTPAWYYEVVAPGFKYNLTDTAAALGLVQLQRLPQFVQRRQHLAARYQAQLAPCPWCCLQTRRRAMCMPGTCTWCGWRRSRAWAETNSSRRCRNAALAPACTMCRCTATPTGATATDWHARAVSAGRCGLPGHAQPAAVHRDAGCRPGPGDRRAARHPRLMAKRLFDIAFALLALVLLGPAAAGRGAVGAARFARAGALPPAARGARWPAVRHLQVPHHAHVGAEAAGPADHRGGKTPASPARALGCAAASWTSCRSSSTCCAAT